MDFQKLINEIEAVKGSLAELENFKPTLTNTEIMSGTFMVLLHLKQELTKEAQRQQQEAEKVAAEKAAEEFLQKEDAPEKDVTADG